jgi:peptidoglycan L-alanyl-D-glutamate endopeptidase CwlK
MPSYGDRSLKVRSELHPELVKPFDVLIKKFDHSLVCGYRNEKDQNEAFGNGFSKLRFPNGPHNKFPSIAVDAYPYPITDLNAKNQRERELYKQRMCYFAGWVMAIADMLYDEGKMKYRLKWGADWNGDTELKDHDFLDYPHFELIIP